MGKNHIVVEREPDKWREFRNKLQARSTDYRRIEKGLATVGDTRTQARIQSQREVIDAILEAMP